MLIKRRRTESKKGFDHYSKSHSLSHDHLIKTNHFLFFYYVWCFMLPPVHVINFLEVITFVLSLTLLYS